MSQCFSKPLQDYTRQSCQNKRWDSANHRNRMTSSGSRGHGRYIESSQSDLDIKCKSPADWLLSHIPRGPLSTFLLKCSWQYSASCCFGHPVTPELVGNLYQRLASCITSSIHCFNNRENSASSNCNSHQSFNIFHQSMKICCEKDGPMSFGAEFVM